MHVSKTSNCNIVHRKVMKVILRSGCVFGPCNTFPVYMQKHNYQVTTDAKSGPFQYWTGTDRNYFEYCATHPPLNTHFNHRMGGYRQGRPIYMDVRFYRIRERLLECLDVSPETILLVDVGGGLVHDLQEFAVKHSGAPGRLILQD